MIKLNEREREEEREREREREKEGERIKSYPTPDQGENRMADPQSPNRWTSSVRIERENFWYVDERRKQGNDLPKNIL